MVDTLLAELPFEGREVFAPEEPGEPGPGPQPSENRSRRVAIVDDDTDFADALADYLQLHGYSVATADGPDGAQGLLEEFDPEVALVDVRLGRHDGLQLVSTLKAARPDLICVVVTAYPEIESAVEAVRQVVYDYLKKPLHTEEVLSLLARCFETRQLQLDKRAAEVALRESEHNYRTLMEQASDGIFVTGPQGVCRAVNQAGAGLLGREPDELLGRPLEIFFAADADGTRPLALKGLEAGGTTRIEAWARHADAGLVPVEMSCGVLSDGRLQASVRGIAERKRAEAALRAHAREVEILNAVIVAGNQAHGLAGLMERVVEKILFLLDLDAGGIHLLNPTGTHAVLQYVKNAPEELIGGAGASIAVDQVPFRGLFARGEPLSIEADLRLAPDAASHGFRSVAAFPITSGRDVIGLLSVASKTRAALANREAAVLRAIGQQLGIVVARARAEESLRASVREKETLLKEIHHRVKNNLQIVSSLHFLQSRKVDDPHAREVFREGQNRIQSMALVHERLYRTEDLARVDFGEYLQTLTSQLARSYQVPAERVQIETRTHDIRLTVNKAIPCGLIVNELVSNALKYAFPEERSGSVVVDVGPDPQRPGGLLLSVADDGVGWPAGVDFRKTQSLGLELVCSLVGQLAGTIERGEGPGTRFRIAFDP